MALSPCGWDRWIGSGKLAQVRVVPVEHPFHRFPQILEHMPPVRYLDRGGSTLARPARVLSRPIARDNFNPRMLMQPGGQGVSGAIGEQIDRTALLQVDQDGGVATPPP
jgi:hypothetical protein